MEIMRILTEDELKQIAARVAANLRGGEVIELVGDVGTGKTTFVKGLALGLAIDDDVQSPSFTINRRYTSDRGLTLSHYDFYRLTDAGIMKLEIVESLALPAYVTVIEWGESIADVLPQERAVIRLGYLPETGRLVEFKLPPSLDYLTQGLTDDGKI
jgi:tRNA threonylcarbamoyladenosine biosynthesis protein TsaE